jgi:hypothetical protein
VNEQRECRYWAERVSNQDELKHAVMVAGPMPEDLERCFGKSANASFAPGPRKKAQHAADFLKAKAADARRVAEHITDEVRR